MKVTKLTDQYTLTEQNGIYIINFGNIKYNVPPTVKLRFEDIDIKNFKVEPKCGCTIANIEVILPNTVESNISYNAKSIGKLDKTVIILNGNKRTELKLTGITE